MKLRLGMIGGGQGAFIGAVHRIAARIDDQYELVCGAFSSDPAKAKASGIALGLNEDRIYGSYKELIEKEKQLPEDERVQVISIVTPNHVHFEPAKLALENGFNVVLDKPMTFSLAEAKELKKVVESGGKQFCLTHTYTGYPMVKEAKQLVKSGKLGKIRKVYVEYPQGWLSTFLEGEDNKQASWRTDPGKSGIAGAMGDIGTHAFNLAEYVSGLSVTQLCADINIVVEGRKLDDDGAVLLKFDNGASGVLMATQIAAGEENNVKVRVYGEKGGLEWQQVDANSLVVKWSDKPAEIWRTGGGYTSSFAQHNTRTPSGHPEGYLEAFANLYRNFALTVKAGLEGKQPEPEWLDFPGVEEGVRGMAFTENVIASGKSDQKWTPFTI
ncbi:Gfo/Idh/MocA family oxidoreductase [Mucilaginibacter sp. RS28]|uniref:Gfo/Idh/MocA family oxidoreductase n=1 Tax=Mucilaginibacter straminoryzae TaxID=2932774 RepID=A0A9X2BCI5_9SPHI|nr:Gfo/Idh/MocA family oxidoreductase [Mucilaginibacter straminoryzae]MCJ8210947.1 Gfo/Idh/MocA family oxidoreductase [Mucilaginibacter straminoryzae]